MEFWRRILAEIELICQQPTMSQWVGSKEVKKLASYGGAGEDGSRGVLSMV